MENKFPNLTCNLPLASCQCAHWPNEPEPDDKDATGIILVSLLAHRAEWRQDPEGQMEDVQPKLSTLSRELNIDTPYQ